MLHEPMIRSSPKFSGGLGFIAGQDPGLVTVAGAAARRPVYLFEKTGMRLVATQYSGEDGTYRFDGLSTEKRFVVVAFDTEQQFNAVIRDNITPAPMA